MYIVRTLHIRPPINPFYNHIDPRLINTLAVYTIWLKYTQSVVVLSRLIDMSQNRLISLYRLKLKYSPVLYRDGKYRLDGCDLWLGTVGRLGAVLLAGVDSQLEKSCCVFWEYFEF